MEWHLPVQEEADWLRLEISLRQLNECIQPTLFISIPPPKLGSAHPNTDCLAASNGICTKRNTVQFKLLLFENEVNNNSQT